MNRQHGNFRTRSGNRVSAIPLHGPACVIVFRRHTFFFFGGGIAQCFCHQKGVRKLSIDSIPHHTGSKAISTCFSTASSKAGQTPRDRYMFFCLFDPREGYSPTQHEHRSAQPLLATETNVDWLSAQPLLPTETNVDWLGKNPPSMDHDFQKHEFRTHFGRARE